MMYRPAKELGVTAVYLNPIFHAPSIHKYDCVDYFHVDPHFGGDEALAELSAALHENGMKLILDISINHTGVEHRWFNKDGVFFDKTEGSCHNRDAKECEYYFYNNGDNSYYAWAGFDTLPTLNYTSEALRETIYKAQDSVLRKWLNPQEYRGAVILQFMLVGTPSVYYGDEVGIDGGVEGDEGYRYPMPWSQMPGRNQETFAFYQKLMHLKQETNALCEGGMKFLYAKGQVVALARFDETEAYIAVMSTDENEQWITLPVGAVGVDARCFGQACDLFGEVLQYETEDEKQIRLKVEAHKGYLIRCKLSK